MNRDGWLVTMPRPSPVGSSAAATDTTSSVNWSTSTRASALSEISWRKTSTASPVAPGNPSRSFSTLRVTVRALSSQTSGGQSWVTDSCTAMS